MCFSDIPNFFMENSVVEIEDVITHFKYVKCKLELSSE